jgi:hypothetical protein
MLACAPAHFTQKIHTPAPSRDDAALHAHRTPVSAPPSRLRHDVASRARSLKKGPCGARTTPAGACLKNTPARGGAPPRGSAGVQATPRVLASVREAQTTRDAVWASRNGRWRQRRLHRGAAGASRAIPVLTPWTARADPRVTAQSALRPMPNAAIPLPKRVHLFHTMVRNR